jgi:hypothetical protein
MVTAAAFALRGVFALCAKRIVAAGYFKHVAFHNAARNYKARIHVKPLHGGAGDTHFLSALRLIHVLVVDQANRLVFLNAHQDHIILGIGAAAGRKCAARWQSAYQLLFSGSRHEHSPQINYCKKEYTHYPSRYILA